MKFIKHIFVLGFLLLSTQGLFAQFEIPNKPKKLSEQKGVYDYINLLTYNDSLSLEIKLIKYSDTTSTQIVVAIIPSTKGENILYLGTQWAQKWGIGQAKEDNGVFILLAKDDRKIAINTGYGVEHLLTDAMSRRIIERDIIPYFKQNDYTGGLNRGVDAVFEVLNGEYQGTRQTNSNDFPIGIFPFLLFVFVVFLIAITKNRRGGNNGKGGKGNKQSGFSIFDAIILSNMGRNSGGFGGSSSGGSSSGGSFGGGGFGGGFGGGGFGGGGASGGW